MRTTSALLLGLMVGLGACGKPGEGVVGGGGVRVPAWARVSALQLEAAARHRLPVAFENELGQRFVLIPNGPFTMGSPEDEEDREDDEPAHTVHLTQPYFVQTTEVTNGQFRKLRGDHTSGTKHGLSLDDDAQPVVQVSWSKAVAFTQWLSEKDPAWTYRLPTEAEWERACRAGTDTPFWWGTQPSAERANFNARVPWDQVISPQFRGTTVRVGSLPPNAWGLHEAHGNAEEWCSDLIAKDEEPTGPATDPMGPREQDVTRIGRRLRGGGFEGHWNMCRAAFRGGIDGGSGRDSVGFRMVATPRPAMK